MNNKLFLTILFAGLLICPGNGLGADQATKEAVEKAVEKVAEKAAGKVAEKAERPTEWWKPTEIKFLVFVIDIDKIDGAAQNFTANIFIRITWKDQRLAKSGIATR